MTARQNPVTLEQVMYALVAYENTQAKWDVSYSLQVYAILAGMC